MTKKVYKQVLGTIGGLALSANVLAGTVFAGSDYFQTLGGTSFDFGTGIGVVNFSGLAIDPLNLGNTDTIVNRLDDAIFSVDGSDTINTEMVALSLQSENAVNVGGTFYNVFVGLDSAQQSFGTMTINHEFSDNFMDEMEGTFFSGFSLNLDATFSEVGGGSSFTIDLDNLNFNGLSSCWSHEKTGKPEFPNESNFFLAPCYSSASASFTPIIDAHGHSLLLDSAGNPILGFNGNPIPLNEPLPNPSLGSLGFKYPASAVYIPPFGAIVPTNSIKHCIAAADAKMKPLFKCKLTNTPPHLDLELIPSPATLYLFIPALLGFFSLRGSTA